MITFLKNKYIFIFLLSIVLCINVHSEPFFKRDVLPYHVQNIGGCKIISIYKNKPPSSMLLDWCKKIPSAQKKGLNTWHDYYSSIELDLGSAFEIAERSLGGSKYSISRNRAVHIVLYPGQYANAAVSVHPKENEIVIFLNEGIIDLIEGTVSSVALEFGALLGEQICGVTFSDWLELMRTPCINGDKANYMPGPDQAQTDNFWPIWYSKNRINCNINYQFIFAHELAHIQRNDLLHAIPNDPLKVEIDCDVRAFKAFARNNDTDKAVFVVVPFFLAMWYYEKYWSEEILQSGLPVYQGIQPALYTRNWKERSKQIIESWGSNATINNFAKKIELLRQLKKYINLRAPLPINELNISVLKNVQI
ncbi:MAG: hypothetical protein KGZ62_05440, partial [Sulfurimonas sp.]|nr:hypothetical protein [Sulfurimonas sp.]